MKDKLVAAILAFFLGAIGVHRFYLGQILYGFLYLLFCWTFIPAVIAFIDFILFLVMSQETFNAKYNRGQNVPQFAPGNYSRNSNDVADELAKLHKLKVDGVITEEEFQRRKSQML